MYIELKTSDPDLIIKVLKGRIETGEAARVFLEKKEDLHRLELSSCEDEATEPT